MLTTLERLRAIRAGDDLPMDIITPDELPPVWREFCDYRAVRGQLQTVADVDPALQLLADHGYVRPVSSGPTGSGRRASPRYETNPKTLGHNGQNGQNAVAG